MYPTYGKQGGRGKAPPFEPTSVTVETIDTSSAYAYQHGHLMHSFEKTASSPRKDDKVPQQNINEMNFTADEVKALTDELKTRDGAFHMKRLVSPSLKRIEKALTELLTRVMTRGEALGNSEKALSRSFQGEMSSLRLLNKLSPPLTRYSTHQLTHCSIRWPRAGQDHM